MIRVASLKSDTRNLKDILPSRPTLSSSLLTHYHTVPHFDTLKIYIAIENIVRKGEIDCNKQLLLFSESFLPYIALFFFILNTLHNVVCNLFQCGTV